MWGCGRGSKRVCTWCIRVFMCAHICNGDKDACLKKQSCLGFHLCASEPRKFLIRFEAQIHAVNTCRAPCSPGERRKERAIASECAARMRERARERQREAGGKQRDRERASARERERGEERERASERGVCANRRARRVVENIITFATAAVIW